MGRLERMAHRKLEACTTNWSVIGGIVTSQQ